MSDASRTENDDPRDPYQIQSSVTGSPPAVPPQHSNLPKIFAGVTFLLVAILVWWFFGDQLNLQSLASQEAELRAIQEQRPVVVLAIAFLVYVAVTGMSLPGAAALTLVYGWYFGTWKAVILVSFASTTGATLAFLFSRYLFKDGVEKNFGERLKTFNEALRREGAFYLFTLRLIPAVPFFVINVVMGLTPMKPWTFWWISQIGMLPGTFVYVWAGASVPSLQQLAEKGAAGIPWQVFIAFAVLGLFPIAIKKIVNSFSKPKPSSAA